MYQNFIVSYVLKHITWKVKIKVLQKKGHFFRNKLKKVDHSFKNEENVRVYTQFVCTSYDFLYM